MWCHAYITLFVAVLGWTDSTKVRTFTLNFGGQNAFNWEMNDPLRGVSRLVSGNTEPVGLTTETITPVYTTDEVRIETTTLPAQPTIGIKPTIDYSNRKPVEEEKFKKVHAFVLCVVQDGYNCGKELGDIDITKHLGPPPNVTDEKYNDSRSLTTEITEKYNDSWSNTPEVTEKYNDSWSNTPEITEKYNDSWLNTPEIIEIYNDSWSNTPEITEKYNDSWSNIPVIIENYNDSWWNTPEITEKYNDSWSNIPVIIENYNDSWSNTPEITEKPSIDNEKNTFRIIADFVPDETTTFSPRNVTTTVQESLNKVTRTYKGTLKTHKKTTLKSNEQGSTDVPLLDAATSNEDPELPQTITTVTQTNIPTYTEKNTFLGTTEKDGIFSDYKSSFDQLQVPTIHHLQKGKFLPASWTEVLHNTPYNTTPQSQDSFVTATTTRTTRDAEQTDEDKEDEWNIEPVSEIDDIKIDEPSDVKFDDDDDDDKENKTTTEEIKPEEIENNSDDDTEAFDNDEKTTTEDDDKDSEENSDKDSSDKEEDKTEIEDETDDDKTTTTEKIDDFTIDMDDLDDFTVNIEPIEFDDDDFDDTMFASSSERIMNRADDESSATVPVIIYASPNGATNFSTDSFQINNNTYDGTTSTEISVVTEVSVKRNPKQYTNSSNDSESMFTKAKKSLYSLWKLAKELNVN